VKGVSKYPYACSAVKYNPNSTVQKNPWVAYVALFSRRPWCAHVTVTPEANRIAVFFLFNLLHRQYIQGVQK